MSNITTANVNAGLACKLAEKFGMESTPQVLEILKSTAFKGQVSDAQMSALLIVANQYGLNPFTKEIYAFPDKNNGIVPVVGVDGWSRIINENSNFDGVSFKQDEESCTCTIHRKDRAHPIEVTEYLSECKRGTGPWQSHPKRMLRHKAMIQCARLAFGYVGIYDQDEAERIVDMGAANEVKRAPAEVAEAARVVVERTDAHEEIIKELEFIAKEGGIDSLQEKWKLLSKEDRAAIGKAEIDRIKAIADAEDVGAKNE